MGFSRYCPSSLDLTNFVVQSCRGTVHRLSLADSLESGIWKSRNLEIWESGIQQKQTMQIIKVQIRSAQNVHMVLISRNKKNSRPHLGQFQASFSMDRTNINIEILLIFLGGPMAAIHSVWG